jgi:hypothetical protein
MEVADVERSPDSRPATSRGRPRVDPRAARTALALFAVAITVLFASAPARASEIPVVLDWHAVDGCPSRDSALDAIGTLLGPKPRADREPLHARADLRTDGAGGFRADVTGVSTDTRVLRGATCREVFDATVIVLALAVDPTIDFAAPPPTIPAVAPSPVPPPLEASQTSSAPAPSAVHLFAYGSWVLDVGSLPSASSGPSLAAGIHLGRTWLEGAATYLLPESGTSAQRSSEGGTFSLLRVAGRGCYALLADRWTIGPCAALAVEWTRAQGFGSEVPTTVVGTAVVLAGGGTARVRLAPALGLRGDLEAAVPFGRPSYVIENTGIVYRSAVVVGRAGLGVELYFP